MTQSLFKDWNSSSFMPWISYISHRSLAKVHTSIAPPLALASVVLASSCRSRKVWTPSPQKPTCFWWWREWRWRWIVVMVMRRRRMTVIMTMTVAMTKAAEGITTMATTATGEDPHLWLEEISAEKCLQWAKETITPRFDHKWAAWCWVTLDDYHILGSCYCDNRVHEIYCPW